MLGPAREGRVMEGARRRRPPEYSRAEMHRPWQTLGRKATWPVLAGVALLAGCAARGGEEAAPAARTPLPLQSGRPLPLPLRGVSADTVEPLGPLVTALRAHSSVPTVRIVFDPGEDPRAYRAALSALRPHAYLMGQILDSTELAHFSAREAGERAARLLARHGAGIDVWEVGNELNGAWAGAGPGEINPKVLAAYRAVKRRGGRTALTLNHWSGPHCYGQSWEATLPYARTLPQEVRSGVDFVLLSVYETSCSPQQRPSAHELAVTLRALGQVFPRAGLGLGEVGAPGREDGLSRDPTFAEKRRLAQRYYGMHAALRSRVGPRFVGGYFWWYYVQDAAAPGRAPSLWPLLERLLSGL